MLYCGIDEAGLGPLLGPLAAASCTSALPPQRILNTLLDLGFWPQCSPQTSKEISIADSKQIYRRDFARLEQLALSVYLCASLKCEPGQLFFQSIVPKKFEKLEWYRQPKPILLPLLADKQKVWQQARELRTALREQGGQLKLSAALFTESEFNEKLATYDNKSLVLRELISSLLLSFSQKLRNSSSESGQTEQESCLANCTIDRLGGLKYYRPWLASLFQKALPPERSILFANLSSHANNSNSTGSLVWNIETCSESPAKSEYWLYNTEWGLKWSLYFQVKGDQQNIFCAIASLWAKYIRELLMWQFNQYWQNKCPAIPKTSGYYRDAKIFLTYLQQELGSLPPDLQRQR